MNDAGPLYVLLPFASSLAVPFFVNATAPPKVLLVMMFYVAVPVTAAKVLPVIVAEFAATE